MNKSGFAGALLTQQQQGCKDPSEAACVAKYGLSYVEGIDGKGLGKTVLHYGQNSGYQAINIAYLRGAACIALLGYDMQETDGKRHFFGNHPGELNVKSPYSEWATKFVRLAEDLERERVPVVNWTRQTALTCFQRGEL